MLFCVFSWPPPSVSAPFSFDDIEFWAGEGANRAALVIDWVENSTQPPALAWGFQWDGTARGSDMLAAVVAADPRLFAKLGGTRADPASVFGLGYDADDDGEFGIDDGTDFDEDGFAFTGPADLGTATDAEDYYAEGWYAGFWHYGVASANPYDGGSWSDTGVGMPGRTLTDGAWDSWAYSPTFNFATFAENPQAATPPDALPGDYNHDGRVDAADYVVWRKNDGDQESYNIWRTNFGEATAASPPTPLVVPEPMTGLIVALIFLVAQIAGCRKSLFVH